MQKENVVLMKMARESLKGKWGLAIGTFLVYLIIIGFIQGGANVYPASVLITLLIAGPLALGAVIFSLKLSRNEDARFEQIFHGFHNFGLALGTYLLVMLFTLLWMLLLIIPGIIAALSYSMAFFIIVDNESIGAMEAINLSKKMMYGYKWKLFCMGLRFFLWSLLCILTLGIGFLWLMPYMYVSYAKFYEDVKENPITKIEE